MKEYKILEKEGEMFVGRSMIRSYFRMKMPNMCERESFIRTETVVDSESKFWFLQNTYAPPDTPVKEGCVRMSLNKIVCVEQIDGDVHITDYSTQDYGGYFPPRLMNMMLSTQMKASIPQFQKLIQNAKENVEKEKQ